jgi:hypothetical protein
MLMGRGAPFGKPADQGGPPGREGEGKRGGGGLTTRLRV